MAGILELIQQFLCYGNSQCMQEFNRFAYQPVEGLFYLVFFPIVFIIVFVYLLSNKLFSQHKGLRILLAMAVFALIILQGWYYMFMQLGKLWYFGLIILGFFWMILYGLRGGIGAQGRTAGGDSGGFGGKLAKRVWARASGQEHALVKAIEADLELLSKMSPQDKEIGEVSGRIYAQLRQLFEFTAVGGLQVGKEYDRLLKRYHELMKKMKVTSVGDLPKAAK